jgi:hypothetical protein
MIKGYQILHCGLEKPMYHNPAVSHRPRTTHLLRHIIVNWRILKRQIELIVTQYFDLSGPALGDGRPAGVVWYLLRRGLVAVVQARAVRMHLQGVNENIGTTVSPSTTAKAYKVCPAVHSSYL